MIKEINQNNFREEIKEGFHIVDVYGTYCGPCKMLAAVLEQVDKKYSFLSILKLNSDENKELSAEFNIKAVPTILLFEDGELVKRQTGALSESQFMDYIADYLY